MQMTKKNISRLSRGKLRESDISKVRTLGESTIVTAKDGIYKIDGGKMKRIAGRKIRESASRFVVVQDGDNQNPEYYLTSKNTLTDSAFDGDVKFFTSEEQARSFAEKAYVPEFLSEREFEYALQNGFLEIREINEEDNQKELEPIFLNNAGGNSEEGDEDFDFEDEDYEGDEGDEGDEGEEDTGDEFDDSDFDDDFEEDEGSEEEE